MIYVITIHTPDSKKGKSCEMDLNISPLDNIKLKSFAHFYNNLTGGYAKITEMKPVVYQDTKPQFESSVYDSLKVMFNTSTKSIQNMSIPYLKRTTSKNDLKNFMSQYIEGFRGIIDVSEKKSI